MMRTMLLSLAQFLFCSAALAQPLALLFESEPGYRPVQGWANGELLSSESAFDANGDGRMDIILREPDESGNLKSTTVLDGRTREVIWEIHNLSQVLGINGCGYETPIENMNIVFADPDGDGIREAIEYLEGIAVFVIDPMTNTLQWSSCAEAIEPVWEGRRDLAVMDVTGDNYEELIVHIPALHVLQIWGKAE